MKSKLKHWWKILKNTFSNFIDNKGMKMGASLAYYTVFSITPLLVLIIALGSVFYGRDAIQGEVFAQIGNLIGQDAAKQIQEMLKNNAMNFNNFWATVLSVLTLLIGASTMFAEIQDSINQIWGLKPRAKKGFIKLLMNRLLSFSMIIVLGFLLLVSLMLTAVMSALIMQLKHILPDAFVNALFILDYGLSFIITTLLFASIFKVLPDARIKLKDVMVGSMVTAGLFMVGKLLIAYYLTNFGNISAYGAAGSIVVTLLWVYYTSLILYIGAEFTHSYMRANGDEIEPMPYAEVENPEKTGNVVKKP